MFSHYSCHQCWKVTPLCGVLFLSSLSVASAAPSTAAIQQLNPIQQVALVIASLDAREEHLKNCRIELNEATTNIGRKDGERTFISRRECQFRANAGVRWLRVVDHGNQPPFAVAADSTMNWDGKTAKGIGNQAYLGTPYDQGRIDSNENPYFTSLRYFEVLGFRARIGQRSISMVSWLRDFVNSGGKPSVTFERCGGAEAIRVSTVEDTIQRSIWLDPSRDFLIVGYDYLASVNQDGSAYNKSTHRVLEAQYASNTWVPKKTRRVDDISGTEKLTERDYDVIGISLGSVSESEVAITFPIGSKVVDSVQNIAYFIRPEGKFELESVVDVREKTLYQPPADRIVGRIDASVAKTYTAEKLSAHLAGVSRTRSIGFWFRTLAIGASVLAGLAWLGSWIVRRRSRNISL